mmetsp:Transcript_37834/g.89833  ORF Transcript_37834/g.89833 Transcript_37834/m.89833 type:complete len:306 (+) Transcript_37834:200-1117(+)
MTYSPNVKTLSKNWVQSSRSRCSLAATRRTPVRAMWVPFQPQGAQRGTRVNSPQANSEQGSGSSGGFEAGKQLELLRKAQEASQKELQRVTSNSNIGADPNTPREFRGHRTVDIRMYDQLAASRNRMSQGLSRANKYIGVLEEKVEERDGRIAALKEEIAAIGTEACNILRMSESALATVQFSVDKQASVDAVEKLVQRIRLMQQATEAHVEALDDWVVRDVPIEFSGVAAEVRVMGDFDGWTNGQLLSANSFDDSVHQTFTTTLRLAPGTYRVKFIVDGQWRTADGWPTATCENGTEENVLIVK